MFCSDYVLTRLFLFANYFICKEILSRVVRNSDNFFLCIMISCAGPEAVIEQQQQAILFSSPCET